MRNTLIIFLFGILGLAFSQAFPDFSINWMAIVLAFSLLALGFVSTLLMTAVLAVFYSAFTLATPFQILLPYFIGLLFFKIFQKNLVLEMKSAGLLLVFVLSAFDWFYWHLPLIRESAASVLQISELLWLLATLLIFYFGWAVMARLLQDFGGGSHRRRQQGLKELTVFTSWRERQ